MNTENNKISDKYEQYKDWLNEIPEISDEEIKRGIKREYLFSNSEEKRLMIEGAIWYREQLKKLK
jgi:hypothetical protein